MSVCAFIAGVSFVIAQGPFTLAWNHSVEHLRWEEDWAPGGEMLVLIEARVRGAGAGMEAPQNAVLRDGWWRYTPTLPPLKELVLANSSFGGQYEICQKQHCVLLNQPEQNTAQNTKAVLSVCE